MGAHRAQGAIDVVVVIIARGVASRARHRVARGCVRNRARDFGRRRVDRSRSNRIESNRIDPSIQSIPSGDGDGDGDARVVVVVGGGGNVFGAREARRRRGRRTGDDRGERRHGAGAARRVRRAVAPRRAGRDGGGGGGGETGGAGEPSRVGERSRRRAGFEIAARARDGGGREDAGGARVVVSARGRGARARRGVQVGKGRRESWTIAAVLLRDVNKCTTMCERVVVVVVVVVPYPREGVRATIAGVRPLGTVRTSRRCRRTVAERRAPPASAA